MKLAGMSETSIECVGLETLYLCLIIAVLSFLVLLAWLLHLEVPLEPEI